MNGVGPRTAPDLSDVGTARPVAAIHGSILDPSSRMMPINRPIRIVMKDGTVVTGRRLNEDTFTVQIMDDKERLRSIAKSDTRSLVVDTTSPMPSYATRLTADEISDLDGVSADAEGIVPTMKVGVYDEWALMNRVALSLSLLLALTIERHRRRAGHGRAPDARRAASRTTG